ncbi:ATPase family gene 2 protein homolog A-like isoform X2 [Linepithema humile]
MLEQDIHKHITDQCSLRSEADLFHCENISDNTISRIKKCDFESSVGGYKNLIDEIKQHVDNVLQNKLISRILLHGQPGVGKSVIAKAVLAGSGVTIFSEHSSNIRKKCPHNATNKLKRLFNKIKPHIPTLILLEDIELLFPVFDSNEDMIFDEISYFFDDINSDYRVVLIATTNLNALSLNHARDFFDVEFEVCIPNKYTRVEILRKLLEKIPNTLTTNDLKEIANTTRDFVGADLRSLCSKAIFYAVQSEPDSATKQVVSKDDFDAALQVVKPMNTVVKEDLNVKWSDICGQRKLKNKLEQALEWPHIHYEAFQRLRIEPPTGVLIIGPPGCSKTMIAKAFATKKSLRKKLNFLSIKGPEIFADSVDDPEKMVIELFQKAREMAPAIVFIDEIDAIADIHFESGGYNYNNNIYASIKRQVLTQLLNQLDSMKHNGVTLLATTNRSQSSLAKDIFHTGRLERVIYAKLPNNSTRKKIFKLKFQKMSVQEDINIKKLIQLTNGYTCAELEAICNEASILALQETYCIDIIKTSHFLKALKYVHRKTPRAIIDHYIDFMKLANRNHHLRDISSDHPTDLEREGMFKSNFQSMLVEEDINIKELVELTSEFSSAEFNIVCTQVGILALEESFCIDAIKKRHFLRIINLLRLLRFTS